MSICVFCKREADQDCISCNDMICSLCSIDGYCPDCHSEIFMVFDLFKEQNKELR